VDGTGTRHDEVNLTVPANPEYLRLARVTAAGLASRIGFSFDQVEDLRLAIDELCFSLTGNEGRSGTVAMTFISRQDSLEVNGEGRFEDGDRPVAISELSRLILEALLDEHSIGGTDRSPTFHLLKLLDRSTP
jgi:hypothetical protein